MEEKNSFYDQLQDEINATPKHDLIMVIGDLNAKVGSDNLAWKMTMGKHGVGNKNENGVRLLEFCTTNDLIIGGTLFEHQEKHKTTWHAKNKNKKCYSNQIDHIMISGRWRRSLADVRAFRGATIGSDHYLLVAKLKLKLNVQKKATNVKKRLDIEKLQNSERTRISRLAKRKIQRIQAKRIDRETLG